jgi:hypothetical protein
VGGANLGEDIERASLARVADWNRRREVKAREMWAEAEEAVEHLSGNPDWTVQLFITDQYLGETISVAVGDGNIHARRGMVMAWLERQKEIERRDAVRQEAPEA